MPMVAWYMLSKESYMKRVINDVLPTGGGVSWEGRGVSIAVWPYRFVRRGKPTCAGIESVYAASEHCGRRQLT